MKYLKKKIAALSFGGMGINQISEKRTPYLFSLLKSNGIAEIKSIKLFPEGSWFFGYPSKDFGMIYRMAYLPENNPLKKVKKILQYFNLIEFLLPEYLRSYVRAGITEILIHIFNNPVISLAKIPLNQIDLFKRNYREILQKKPSIYSYLKDNDILYYDEFKSFSGNLFKRILKRYNRININRSRMFFQELQNDNSDVFLISLNRIDFLNHIYGSQSLKSLDYCLQIDNFCKKIQDYLKEKFEDYDLLIFSDHGLSDINRYVNISKDLKNLSIKQGKDYDIFLDSICARFWPKSDYAKDVLVDCLNNIKYGFIMKEDDYIHNYLPYDKDSRRRYGEIIFMMENHSLILPNYWQGKTQIKGMHSYLEEDDSNLNGFFIIDSSNKDRNITKSKANYWDIAPSIIHALGKEIPKFMTGIPIFID